MTPLQKGETLPQRRRGAEKFRREIRVHPWLKDLIYTGLIDCEEKCSRQFTVSKTAIFQRAPFLTKTPSRFQQRCDWDVDELSLTPRQIYEVLPDPAEANGMIRVVDDSGEDYLFEVELFEEVKNLTDLTTDLTVGLTWPMKATIYRIANQRGISMSALLREWIDEHLDLPVVA